MNTQRKLIIAMSLCAANVVPGLSIGALIDRGGGLIYDTDLNITWLSDANHGRNIGSDPAINAPYGAMTWVDANTWAANLSYYDSMRGVTYNDWRLPIAQQTDPSCSSQGSAFSSGFNCTGSELGHLIYIELGGVAGQPIVTTHNANYSLFTNIQSYAYWTSTEFAWDTNEAWHFYPFSNWQSFDEKSSTFLAWAVRDGDVYSASAVPVPAAAWLFASGLLGLIGLARKNSP